MICQLRTRQEKWQIDEVVGCFVCIPVCVSCKFKSKCSTKSPQQKRPRRNFQPATGVAISPSRIFFGDPVWLNVDFKALVTLPIGTDTVPIFNDAPWFAIHRRTWCAAIDVGWIAIVQGNIFDRLCKWALQLRVRFGDETGGKPDLELVPAALAGDQHQGGLVCVYIGHLMGRKPAVSRHSVLIKPFRFFWDAFTYVAIIVIHDCC